MDRNQRKVNIGGGSEPLLVFFLLISSFSHPVVTQYQGFFWKNEYAVKPTPYIEGTELKIPVIEGEVEVVQCFVRADSDEKYKIEWDYEDFQPNANNTNTFTVGEVGAEFAVSNVTINVVNPADIDDQIVACIKENRESIGLRFKVFVQNSNVPCRPCNGTEIKLRRYGNKQTEDEDLRRGFEENLKKKLKKKQNFAEDEVYSVSDGADICGCKKEGSTTTESPNPNGKTTDPSLAIGFSILAVVILVAIISLAYVKSEKFRNYLGDGWNSTKNCLDFNCMRKYHSPTEHAQETALKMDSEAVRSR